MSADQQGKGHPDPDWLDECDAWAAEAKPSQDWIFVPSFILLRYLELRPQHHPKTFNVVVDGAMRMANKIRSEDVLKDLSVRQELQLGALVSDIDSDVQVSKQERTRQRDYADGAKRGRGSARILNQKFRKVVTALDDVASYLEGLHKRWRFSAPEIRGRGSSPRDIRNDAHRYRSMIAAGKDVDALQQRLDRLAQATPWFKGRGDIQAEAVTELTSFFVTECGVSQTVADIRTAKIGNLLWGWDYTIRETYDGVEKFRGVDAVRSHRRRRKKSPAS